MIYVKVSIPILLYKTFTYSSKNKNLFITQGVKVPLKNRTVNGFIVDISSNTKYKSKIHPIYKANEYSVKINKELIETINWMSKYYICPIGKVLKSTIPYQFFIPSQSSWSRKVNITDFFTVCCYLYLMFSLCHFRHTW